MGGSAPYQRKPTLEIKIKCKCPMCEKTFEKNIFWTGNTKPRIYCDSCKKYVKNKSFNNTSTGHRRPDFIPSF